MNPLTRGELRALQAIARYSSAKEASAVLGITDATLRNELARAFKKLGVNNRTAAFQRLGWLRPPRLLNLRDDDRDFEEREDQPPPPNRTRALT